MKINLGCGRRYLPGYLNCDVVPEVKADRHFDLDIFPYPLETGSADEILMDNVLEHLGDIPRVLTELHRVLKPGGVLRIIVPYAKADWAYQDPTHRHYFTERSMDYFAGEGRYDFYAPVRYELRRAELVAHRTNWMHRVRNLLPFRSVLRYFLFNMYDVVEFDLAKPEADGAAGRGLGSGRGS
ncbi:MAG TPA: methyltransferase domain-containing protein [Verrucomicrobiota bacterium]|nr:methyltransferase domain-containing protein [Verrucomicrobiota bacterium]HNU52582.1 methyltransferase domain-containing protein [Verrucomicrobiota bacterium]